MAHQPSHPEPHDPHHAAVGHLVSPKILIATAAALLVLTIVTVQVASVDFSVVDLRELNIFVALGIAVIKASLVCLYFMHLRWDRPFNAFLLIASLALVALFISFALTDRSEYMSEIVPGESTVIQGKLNESPQAGGPLSGVSGVPEH